MSNADYRSVAITLYEERLRNDAWSMREMFHEKALWEIVGMGSGTIKRGGNNSNELRIFIERWVEDWRWISYDFLDILGDRSRLACRYNLLVEHTPTQRRFETQGADFFRFEYGLVRHLTSFSSGMKQWALQDAEDRA